MGDGAPGIERDIMAERIDKPAEWTGRDVFDAHGHRMGAITGLAFPRRRFGTRWLVLQSEGGVRLPVPLIGIRSTGGRLVLPYPRSYVESGPAIVDDQQLSQDDQRRLGLHYGFDDQVAGVNRCCQTCGLCSAARKARQSS